MNQRSSLRKVRRSLVVTVAAVVGVVSTACWPQFPPAPMVTETTLTPSPVVAGSAFTLTATATSSSGKVASVFLLVRTPSSGYLPWTPTCAQGQGWHEAPAAEVHVSWDCTIPAGAPNGTWTAQINVFDQGYGASAVDVPFEVIGGSDDTQGPTATIAIPPTVAAGTSFSFTVRASDEHPTETFNLADVVTLIHDGPLHADSFECTGDWTAVDATTSDFVATCVVPTGQAPGVYGTPGLQMFDAFGQMSSLDITTTVV